MPESPLEAAVPLEPLLQLPPDGPRARTRQGRWSGYAPTGYLVRTADRLRWIPHRRLLGAILAAAAVLAVCGVVFAITGQGGSVKSPGAANLATGSHVLSFPRRIGAYLLTRHVPGHTLTDADPLVSAARTAIYQRPRQPAPTASLLSHSVGVEVGRVRGVSPAGAVRRIYADFKRRIGRVAHGQAQLGRWRYFPAGSLGGQVRCWNVTVPSPNGHGRSAGAACVWVDHDTFGFVLAPALRTSSLATTLLMFRSAIEMLSH